MRTAYPHAIKSLAFLQTGYGGITGKWVVDIAGPFCVWPKSKDRGVYTHMYTRFSLLVSKYFKRVPYISATGEVITILVGITDEEHDRMIKEVYDKETSL